jgi:hypothetical protein
MLSFMQTDGPYNKIHGMYKKETAHSGLRPSVRPTCDGISEVLAIPGYAAHCTHRLWQHAARICKRRPRTIRGRLLHMRNIFFYFPAASNNSFFSTTFTFLP